ncbi:MAG: hypothetical protein J7518_13100 [Nocardioidaceae bacterium]|nr:hypothetical protein [Nocardioidaceae bacterium]
MAPLSPARRAADEFASVVDGTRADDRYADLLAYVEVLRAQEAPASRPEFAADLRARLMDAADTLLLPADDRAPAAVVALDARRQRRQRKLSLAAAALVVVGGTAGVAAASEHALPGDPLYPIKRGLESAQASFNSSDSGKGQDLLRQASTRLDEVGGLIDGDHSSGQIRSTLSSYRHAAADGADLIFVSYQRNGDGSDITRLRTLLGSQLTELDRLSDDAPSDTDADFTKARNLVADLDEQARTLCTDCGPAGALSAPQLTAAHPLKNLLLPPAQGATGVSPSDQAAIDLAAKAGSIAKGTPLLPLPTSPQSPPAGSPSTPGLPLPSGTPTPGTVGGAVTGVTDGVGGLLNQVTNTVGQATKPLTDPLAATLSTLLGVPTATPKP